MFGTFSVINIIVLLNLLIAMMNHSYQLISVSSVSFEKFRSKNISQSLCFKTLFTGPNLLWPSVQKKHASMTIQSAIQNATMIAYSGNLSG